MALIRHNIWFLFYIILFLGLLFLGIVSFSKWKSLEAEYILKNENSVNIIARSSRTYLSQIESLLKILGEQLIKENRYDDVVESRAIFTDLMKINKEISGFGLLRPDGSYSMFSGDIKQGTMLPNLLEQPASRDSFKKALNSTKLVLGRTYFFAPLDAFVVPARKAVRDKNGKVVAVIALAIFAENTYFLDDDVLFDDTQEIHLIRANDYYRQLTVSKEHKQETNKVLYDTPLDPDHIAEIDRFVFAKYAKNLQEMQQTRQVFTFTENKNIFDATEKRYFFYSAKYIKDYELWAVSAIPYSIFLNVLIQDLLLYFLVFCITYGIIWWLFRSISSAERSRRESLYHQATHDLLTRLPNRHYLLEKTDEWFAHPSIPFNLLFIDLDNFKHVNDSSGHHRGDQVLQEVARRLQTLKKSNELIIRQGGDEFVFFSRLRDKEAIEKLCKKTMELLREPYIIDQHTFLIGASIGVAVFPNDANELHELMSCADMALHKAKKHKNEAAFFTDAIKNNFLFKSEIANHFPSGLGQDEFYMEYQPQVNHKGSLYGVEALIRWNSAQLGRIRPDQFIPVAEERGFMTPLGNFILETVLHEMNAIQKETNQSFQISINISLRQFTESGFYDKVADILNTVDLDPRQITLEVTEGLFIENIEYIAALLKRFRALGMKISIDDFGTGYSSLSLLKKIPLDELKIDKQFVDDMLEDDSSKQMIHSIIAIGNSLGYTLLAEGIENREQADFLHEIGCTLFQGYQFSKPIGIEALQAYIHRYGTVQNQ